MAKFITRFFMVLLCIGMVSPAQAKLDKVSENGFAMSHVVRVTTSPEESWNMIMTPSKWWSAEHSWTGDANNYYLDSQAGGCFCELIPEKKTGDNEQAGLRGSVQHMRIIFADKGRLLRMSGALGPMQGEAIIGTLTIVLKPIAGGTEIKFEYVVGGFARFSIPDLAPIADKVIVEQASRLGMALRPLIGTPANNDAAKPADAPKEDVKENDKKDATAKEKSGQKVKDEEPTLDLDNVMEELGNADKKPPVKKREPKVVPR